MFDKFSSSLQKIFKNLRGYGKLSERNIQDSLREIRMTLLEADVNFQVARDFIAKVKEKCLGKEAIKRFLPMQAGDVPATYADVSELTRDVGFKPATSIEDGLARFVDWYRGYYG